MNIFYIHYLAKKCAQQSFDKHVVKMILETAQLLSYVWWILLPHEAEKQQTEGNIYKNSKSHIKHPCTLWATRSRSNYVWLTELGMELCKEYTHRYGKIHKTQQKIEWFEQNIPSEDVLPELGMTSPALAMPEECKCKSPIESYRNLYQSEHKRYLAIWTKRKRPEWYSEEAEEKGRADRETNKLKKRLKITKEFSKRFKNI